MSAAAGTVIVDVVHFGLLPTSLLQNLKVKSNASFIAFQSELQLQDG